MRLRLNAVKTARVAYISFSEATELYAYRVSCKPHSYSSTLMTVKLQTEKDFFTASTNVNINQETEKEKVLCSHCQRTSTNGIKCKGICVADNDY
jgi:hypothetical protein